MTKSNTGNAQRASDLAKEARAAAEHGTAKMQSMSQAMDEIKGSGDAIANGAMQLTLVVFHDSQSLPMAL